MLADLLIAFLALGAFVLSSRSANPTWIILSFAGLVIAAGTAGYFETSAKRVWIHPLLIMSPELIALPIALLTCHGFECGGVIGFLMLASLFTLVLAAVSFTGFFIKHRMTRASGA